MRFLMVGLPSLSSLRERNDVRRGARVRVTQPLLIARPRSSLVLREHDSSGVLAFKSVKGETMVKTVLVMATITIIACAAVIAIHELLVRARHPQAGPPPRRRAF
jgi:adenine C2-methylase RlmN of 23S rRNA A2503 and tRNA A37